MLGIGEFAGLTGVSVKALRHYDEKGVLAPAAVDETTGYRRYAESQVRDGVIVRALRDAGVPLIAVGGAVAGGMPADALADHRRGVLERRDREDRAHAAAQQVLAALAVPVSVGERTLPAQPYVGRVIAVPVDEAENLSDEQANRSFAELYAAMQTRGLAPSGPFWTTMRAGDRGTIEIVGCWPIATAAADDGWGTDIVVGSLPPRTELVATWRPSGGEDLPEGSLHPAVVGLFDAIADRDDAPATVEVRQTVVAASETDYLVEVALTMSTAG